MVAVQCDYQGPRFAGRNVPWQLGLGCVLLLLMLIHARRKMGDFSHGYTTVHNYNIYGLVLVGFMKLSILIDLNVSKSQE